MMNDRVRHELHDRWMARLLDEELAGPEREEIRARLKSCPDCWREYSSWHGTLSGPEPSVPQDSADRLAAAPEVLYQMHTRKTFRRVLNSNEAATVILWPRRLIYAAAGLAATLVLAWFAALGPALEPGGNRQAAAVPSGAETAVAAPVLPASAGGPPPAKPATASATRPAKDRNKEVLASRSRRQPANTFHRTVPPPPQSESVVLVQMIHYLSGNIPSPPPAANPHGIPAASGAVELAKLLNRQVHPGSAGQP